MKIIVTFDIIKKHVVINRLIIIKKLWCVKERKVTVDEDSTSKIYYGTMTGKLSKTNDYLMYPAKLSAGEYLQAKLILPTIFII